MTLTSSCLVSTFDLSSTVPFLLRVWLIRPPLTFEFVVTFSLENTSVYEVISYMISHQSYVDVDMV